jgi:hypothetical protein
MRKVFQVTGTTEFEFRADTSPIVRLARKFRF